MNQSVSVQVFDLTWGLSHGALKVDGGSRPDGIIGLDSQRRAAVMQKHRTKSSLREAQIATGRPVSS